MTWGTLRVLGLIAVVTLFCLAVLTGCGEAGSGNDMDRRYQECTDSGGDFHGNEYDKSWSCTHPNPTPIPSPTLTESQPT